MQARTTELNELKIADVEQLHVSKGVGTEAVAVVIGRVKDDLNTKAAPELKHKCSEKGLKVGGSKGELIERLIENAKEQLKTEMVKSLVAFEAKARAEARAHEAKIQDVLSKLKKEYSGKTREELKEICVSRGIKAGASKEDRIKCILVHARRKNGEVDGVLASMAREERRNELLSMDEKVLMELCSTNGVNPLVKAVMVDRLLLNESANIRAV